MDIRNTSFVWAPAAKQTLEMALQTQAENATVHENAINLTLNAFAFMRGYPKDASKATFHHKAPDRRVRQVTVGSPKEKERALSKLQGLGFSPYFKIGAALGKELPSNFGLESKEGVRPHRRRGHWMQQVYGQGRMLRKIMWRKPCLVGYQNSELPVSTSIQKL